MKRLLRSDGFDVIVVGSGLAGLSAALTVAEFGYSPVILEKACEPGGLTRRAYGFFNAADARRQIALGIDDSPEKQPEAGPRSLEGQGPRAADAHALL
ncbi:MAG: FAD-dependent oxidoreductase [Sutterella wadsworthensis]